MTHLKPHRSFRITLTALGAALLLAACGGSNNGNNGQANFGNACSTGALVAGTGVPQSATASSGGAIALVKCVVATSENSEPLLTGDATLGTSDMDDPDPNI